MTPSTKRQLSLMICCIFVGSGAVAQTRISGLNLHPTSMQLSDSFCTKEESAAKSLGHCSALCIKLGCAMLSFNKRTRLCTLVHFYQSETEGCSRERRTVGDSEEDEVWLTEHFSELSQQASTTAPVYDVANGTFINTNEGPSGSVQAAAVPQTGCYRIEALGASGGSINYQDVEPEPELFEGGRGAYISGFFNLTAGTLLSIVVGQQGRSNLLFVDSVCSENCVSGGGGGSFVYTEAAHSELLLAAGGGGGAAVYFAGIDGQGGANGTDSTGMNFLANGFGGASGQAGADMSAAACGTGGSEPCLAGGPGAGWAFNSSARGLGGGNRGDGWVGFGGGGGGFSGGGSGSEDGQAGGGGGSFCSGGRCNATNGGNSASSHGRVVVTPVAWVECQAL